MKQCSALSCVCRPCECQPPPASATRQARKSSLLRTSYPRWVCCLLVKESNGHNPLFVLRNIHNRPKEEVHLGPKRESFIAFIELDGPGIESRWDPDFPHLSRPALRSN